MDTPLKGLDGMTNPRFPDVEVQLTGEDGNVFNLMSIVSRKLPAEYIKEFRIDIMSSESYEDALIKMSEWVVVI
jgi:hypothetical protein